MLDFFSQMRLKRKGFSSGKKRRKQVDNDLLLALQEGKPVRGALFALFAAAVAALAVYGADPEAIFSGEPLQAVVVVVVIALTMIIQYYVTLPGSFVRNSQVLLMLMAVLSQLLMLNVVMALVGKFVPGQSFLFMVVPYALAPLLLTVLLGRNHGTFAAVYASLLGGMLVEKSLAFPFLIFSLICGFVAVYRTHKVRRRSRLVTAGLHVGAAAIVLGFTLAQINVPPPGLGDFTAPEWKLLGTQCLTAMLVSMVVAMLISGMLPVIEGIFGITTTSSWIELADLNHPLLKRMTIEAPGTYHHSLVVATLSEAAAEDVGANAPMCRVCAYFHDIGKLNKPEYYIENIGDRHNPHDDLTPTMSALIITSHVKDGEDLAIKHRMNREIIDVIKEHHGTSLVYFFYHRAMKQKEEKEAEVKEGQSRDEDIPEVKESNFRYPGPKPQSRESAIISLADSIESASRSLQKPTPAKIDQLINEIVRTRLKEGQLDECDLTLSDLATIKESFAATLRSMMHTRIAYPKRDDAATGGGDKTKAKDDDSAARKRKIKAKAKPKSAAAAAAAGDGGKGGTTEKKASAEDSPKPEAADKVEPKTTAAEKVEPTSV